MRFEWDADKAAANLTKHRVPFDEVVTVFYDPLAATFGDPDHSDDENHRVAVGYSARGRLLVVCHVERGAGTRLISSPRHRSRESRSREWLGGRFDPDRFDPKRVKFDDPARRYRLAFEEPRKRAPRERRTTKPGRTRRKRSRGNTS